jgi:tRNA(Ile)-lysidine synthase
MVQEFIAFVKSNRFFLPKESVLLAVSGGVDSVVMVNLFQEAGFKCGIAHCNFGLRGKESDGDAEFVKNLAASKGLKYYSKKFNTKAFAKTHKCSIQEAARKLRYAWFEEIRKAHGYACISTAHHADDSIETFFINLLRGTGLAGLTGIPVKNGFLTRPLAFAGKKQIQEYASMLHLDCREDSSNKEDKYLRNRIRHHLVPLMEELSPAFRETIHMEMGRFRQTREALDHLLQAERKNLIVPFGKNFRMSRAKLLQLKPLGFFLYEWLKEFGFKQAVISDLAIYLEKNKYTGKVFFSATHELHSGRDYFEIRKRLRRIIPKAIQLTQKKGVYKTPFSFHTDCLPGGKKFLIPADASVACLDAAKLTFPLVLRKWKEGDWFRPLGMKGSKLLSDFFTDQKLTSLQKEETWVLESGGQIAWVVGYRIDDRFKLDTQVKQVFQVRLG